MFRLIVVRHKLMTITEFYNADLFDVLLIADNMEEVDRDACERMRNIMWAQLAPNSKKKLSPEDLMKFSWEMKKEEVAPTTADQFNEAFKQFNKQN